MKSVQGKNRGQGKCPRKEQGTKERKVFKERTGDKGKKRTKKKLLIGQQPKIYGKNIFRSLFHLLRRGGIG
jgi:hypothetical protein